MSTFYDLSLLAQAVYGDVPVPAGWAMGPSRSGDDGFRAVVYIRNDEKVVAFRGTTLTPGDLTADLALGLGMNTGHFAQAGDFMKSYRGESNVTVCGHSLGGAIAQIVGNRGKFKFATFNAPGVAVVASRNADEMAASVTVGTAFLRVGFAALSALRDPGQAMQDVAAAFNVATGVNVCLNCDVVSQIGVHYGKVVRIPGTEVNPATQHPIETVVNVLRVIPLGSRGIGDYFPSP